MLFIFVILFLARKLNFDESASELAKVDEVSGKEDDLEIIEPVSPVVVNGHHTTESTTELTNAHSPVASIPLVNGHAVASKTVEDNQEKETLDGHYFHRQADALTERLSAKVAQIEQDILTPGLSEEG